MKSAVLIFGIMNYWTPQGTQLNSIRFNSFEMCQAAVPEIVKQIDANKFGNSKPIAICLEDKP